MKSLRVLIACEFSGIVRDAFTARGHEATSCDLLPTESPGLHYQGDVRNILDAGWDLMIAHPPCTYLSNAGARFLYPKGQLNESRLALGMEAKRLFMFLLDCDIDKICVENPVHSRVFGIRRSDQIIEPYQFGHPYKKKTCLWIKGLPMLEPTEILSNPQSTKIAGNWFNKGGKDRQKNRARTFHGIANAMAYQWG